VTCYKWIMVTIDCSSCGNKNDFDQPYPFHAGFANQGFLYNDAGNLTLVWSSFDPAYEAIVGKRHPWGLSNEQRSLLESALREAPFGGRWRFTNPARCKKCGQPVKRPYYRDDLPSCVSGQYRYGFQAGRTRPEGLPIIRNARIALASGVRCDTKPPVAFDQGNVRFGDLPPNRT
jgi:hypothetical protein